MVWLALYFLILMIRVDMLPKQVPRTDAQLVADSKRIQTFKVKLLHTACCTGIWCEGTRGHLEELAVMLLVFAEIVTNDVTGKFDFLLKR